MLAGRSELKALESVIAASAARAEAERNGFNPRVDLAGSYSRYDDDRSSAIGDGFGASLRNEEESRAQMVVSLNLFQGFTTEASVARA